MVQGASTGWKCLICLILFLQISVVHLLKNFPLRKTMVSHPHKVSRKKNVIASKSHLYQWKISAIIQKISTTFCKNLQFWVIRIFLDRYSWIPIDLFIAGLGVEYYEKANFNIRNNILDYKNRAEFSSSNSPLPMRQTFLG